MGPYANGRTDHQLPETGMRKIKAQLFISLDGVVEAPDQWHFPYFNEEMGLSYALAAAPGEATYDDAKTHLPQH